MCCFCYGLFFNSFVHLCQFPSHGYVLLIGGTKIPKKNLGMSRPLQCVYIICSIMSMKSTSIFLILQTHNRNRETIKNCEKKMGFLSSLIISTNLELQNCEIQNAKPHGCLPYNNLQDKVMTITQNYPRQPTSLHYIDNFPLPRKALDIYP